MRGRHRHLSRRRITRAPLPALIVGVILCLATAGCGDDETVSSAPPPPTAPSSPSADTTTGVRASSFASDGDLIEGWYWLRDATHSNSATWTFDALPPGSDDLVFDVEILATDQVDGGPGVDGRFYLDYGRPGNGETEATYSGHQLVIAPNVSPEDDPVGYTCKTTVTIARTELPGATSLILRVARGDELEPGAPIEEHIAVRLESFVLPGPDDTAQDGGDTDSGSESANALDIRLDPSHTEGWELFHLTASENAVTPFPPLPWPGGGDAPAGEYAFDADVGGYRGVAYDAASGTALLASGAGVWTDAGETHYCCMKKKILIEGTPLAPVVNVAGQADDDFSVFLRSASGQLTLLYRDPSPGPGIFSGTVDFASLEEGTNWVEVYATSGVFSGTTTSGLFALDMTPLTVPTEPD